MFSIPLISVRLLLTAGNLEFAALQGRVSCAGAKGASDGGVIVAAVAADGQHRSTPGGTYRFITARSIHSRVGQSDELSSMQTSASYCDVSPLRMTTSTSFGSTGLSTHSSSFTI